MGSPYGVQALTIGQVCRIIVLRHRILTSMSSSHGRACPLVHILFTSSGWFNLHTCSMFSQVAIVERPDHNSTNPLDGIRDTQITPHQPISPLVNNWFYARLHLNAPTTHCTTSQSTRCNPIPWQQIARIFTARRGFQDSTTWNQSRSDLTHCGGRTIQPLHWKHPSHRARSRPNWRPLTILRTCFVDEPDTVLSPAHPHIYFMVLGMVPRSVYGAAFWKLVTYMLWCLNALLMRHWNADVKGGCQMWFVTEQFDHIQHRLLYTVMFQRTRSIYCISGVTCKSFDFYEPQHIHQISPFLVQCFVSPLGVLRCGT